MKIRPYSKSELAQAYAPEITSQAALNRLAAWIRLNRPLTEALRQTGYYTKQRLFTSRQVALIFEYQECGPTFAGTRAGNHGNAGRRTLRDLTQLAHLT